MSTSLEHAAYKRRQNRTRAALAGNQSLPRLSVYRSLRHIRAQVIDDRTGITLASAHSDGSTGTKTEQAQAVGQAVAQAALASGIAAVRFDRGGNRYHGRIAALAEAARQTGLTF